MRTHTQIKEIFFTAVLIAFVTLNIMTAPAQVKSAGQPKSPAVGAPPRDARVLTPDNSPSFLPAVTYGSGGVAGFSVVVADVNGDGKPDLLVANYCPDGGCGNGGTLGRVGVLLGNGDGTFGAAVGYSSGGVGAGSVAVADLNGDGKPDLLVSNSNVCPNGCGNGTVGVLLGNGDGTFRPAVTYSSGAFSAQSVAVDDVNGDGKPDIVVANLCILLSCSHGMLGVLLGNGDGTFRPAVIYDSGGSDAMSITVADVNGDSKPDLVVANILSATVGVLLGNGDGTFQTAVNYGSGGIGATSVAVADVNGDGKPDLLVANDCVASAQCSNGTVGVLLGNGDGTFQAAVDYNSGGQITWSGAIADVNGDGKPDLLVANVNCYSCRGTVGVLLGNGDGTFQPAMTYDSGGIAAISVAVADVNGDNKADLLAVNYNSGTVGVLLNNTTEGKSTTSTSLISSLNPSIYGQKVTWTATVTSSGSIMPTGIVRFKWQSFTETFTIGSATLNASGVATLTKSNLNADLYPLTAVYSGDVNNLRSTSAIVNQVVTETTSAAKITSTPNPSTLGQAVTFMATITSPTVIPTGPVTFMVGTKVLGIAQLSSGKAKFTTSTLPVGSTKVTAIYYGDSNIAKSSASVIQTVQ